jgi:hypothetical protein
MIDPSWTGPRRATLQITDAMFESYATAWSIGTGLAIAPT